MKIKIIAIILALSLFLIGMASANCFMTTRANCVGDSIVLGVSSLTDAHAELFNQGNYNYVLCCDEGDDTACNGTNKIVGLEDVTNSHVEIPELGNYANDVCFEDFACTSRTSSCAFGEVGLLSVSANTGAHIGGFNNYETKICCTSEFLIDDGICGNGILGAGEECDDGNLIDHDSCSSVCENEIYNNSWCSDGILFTGSEECDDGNLINGDGCTSTCRDEGDDDRRSSSNNDNDCNARWDCSQWSECDGGFKTRTCTDLKKCGTSYGKPDEALKCSNGVFSSVEDSMISLGDISEDSKIGGFSTTTILWILIILTIILFIGIIVALLR